MKIFISRITLNVYK